MKTSYLVAYSTAFVFIGLSLASGPLLGLSLTTQSQTDFNPGTGSFDATVIETPDTIIVKPARYGANVSHIHAPAVKLHISDMTGQPTVIYKLIFNELNYSSSTVWFLDSPTTGEYDLEFAQKTIAPDRFNHYEYNGTLEVIVRDDAGEQILVKTDITLKVQK